MIIRAGQVTGLVGCLREWAVIASSDQYYRIRFDQTPLLMKSSSKKILTAWQDYLKCSGAEKSKIPASQVHEDHQLVLNSRTCKETPNGVLLTISEQVRHNWCRHFVKYDENNEITQVEPVSLLFPVLRCTEIVQGKSQAKYLPLFSFSLPESFFKQPHDALLIPVKDGLNVSALPFVFREVFGVHLAELGEDRHMMSIGSALTGQKYDTFLDAFLALQKWVTGRLNGRTVALESGFSALVAPLHNEDYQLKRDEQDFSWLCESQEQGMFPLLEQYLNHEHQPQTSSPAEEPVVAGLFETQYPLGHGQMAAIQAINQEARLIAVQGAPGTGKTTLFKSLIAQQLTARALAIAGGKDRNMGMLVTSTAIKAVENIIDDLRQDPVTQGLDWLWFHGGSNAQVQLEFARLERLIERWRTERYDESAQQGFLAILRQHDEAIHRSHRAFQDDKAAVQHLVAACALDVSTAEALPERLAAKREALARALQEEGIDVLLTEPEALDMLLARLAQALQAVRQQTAEYQQALKLCQTLQATWPQSHDVSQILAWVASPLRPALEFHYHDYPRRGFRRLLARFYDRTYRGRLAQMQAAVPVDFQQFNLSALDHAGLVALADAGATLAAQPENLRLLARLLTPAPDGQQESKLLSLCTRVTDLQTQSRQVQAAAEAAADFRVRYPEKTWCDILRKRFISQHREMFEAALGYLWQEQLKRKTALEEVLTLWQALLNGRHGTAGSHRWLDNLEEFYTALSLVYPVMATTLVSAWKMAGYRKLADLKGHKPWHLALCDEAGMVSVEALVPLLSRSEKAMIVGDPLQIEPIRTLSDHLKVQLRERHFNDNNTLYERVSPATVTGWHRAAGSLSGRADDIGGGLILDEHRRCQKPIADLFIRLAGYRGVTVETTRPDERIARAFEQSGGHHLMFYSVEGRKGDLVNTNGDEVDAIEQLLDKLEAAGYDLTADVGIVTPYSNQKNLLIKRLGQRMNHQQKNCIGTVHQFQGVGFEVIIYSPVICHPRDSATFQNDAPNMLNVVVSRAKQQFIVVGNYHRLRQAGSFLKILAETVAEDFLLEQGSQHPRFEELKTAPQLQRYYRDCEHVSAFSALAAQSEQELIVIAPWIRRGGKAYQRPELAQLVATRQRGVRVKVYYGYHPQHFAQPDDNDESLLAEYREKLGPENVVRLTQGTHEKVVMIDGRHIVLGSWNWLSHGYHMHCERDGQFRHAIRHEISVGIEDSSLIQELRTRLGLV